MTYCAKAVDPDPQLPSPGGEMVREWKGQKKRSVFIKIPKNVRFIQFLKRIIFISKKQTAFFYLMTFQTSKSFHHSM